MSQVVGYLNTTTGVEAYHTSTQTPIEQKQVQTFQRDGQTADVRSRKAQSTREAGTQMTRSDLIVFASPFELETAAKPYYTSQDVMARRVQAAQTLQRRWRGFLGMAKAVRLRDQKAKEKNAVEDRVALQKEMAENARRHEIQRRLNPKTKEDFRLVMEDIWKWSEQNPGETAGKLRLIQQLEKLRIKANQQKKRELVTNFLDQMTAPKLWTQKSSGTVTEVETPEVTRNRELVQLHKLLEMGSATKPDERLEILLKLKWEIKVFDSALTRELNDLIDREADMLNRKRPASSLVGLRKRISWLFLHFISDPQFNPGAVSNTLRKQSKNQTVVGTINIIAH
jgi:hypothetical protein